MFWFLHPYEKTKNKKSGTISNTQRLTLIMAVSRACCSRCARTRPVVEMVGIGVGGSRKSGEEEAGGIGRRQQHALVA